MFHIIRQDARGQHAIAVNGKEEFATVEQAKEAIAVFAKRNITPRMMERTSFYICCNDDMTCRKVSARYNEETHEVTTVRQGGSGFAQYWLV